MNRLGIVILVVLSLISSYAFSHASEINCKIIHCRIVKQGEAVKIAWDEVTKLTNGKNISSVYSEGYVIGYLLYINENKDSIKDHPKPPPTFDREATIAPGIWNGSDLSYVGVQTAIYKYENLKSEPVEVSDICWSDIGSCTNNNPFVLKVKN